MHSSGLACLLLLLRYVPKVLGVAYLGIQWTIAFLGHDLCVQCVTLWTRGVGAVLAAVVLNVLLPHAASPGGPASS